MHLPQMLGIVVLSRKPVFANSTTPFIMTIDASNSVTGVDVTFQVSVSLELAGGVVARIGTIESLTCRSLT